MTMIPITVPNPETGEPQMSQLSVYDILKNPGEYVTEEYIVKLCNLVDQMEGDRQRAEENQKTAAGISNTYWTQIQNLRADVASRNARMVQFLEWLKGDEAVAMIALHLQSSQPTASDVKDGLKDVLIMAEKILEADDSYATTACYSLRTSQPTWERLYEVLADVCETILEGRHNRINLIGISEFMTKKDNVMKIKGLKNLFLDMKKPGEKAEG